MPDKPKLPEAERNAFTTAYSIWTKYREARTDAEYQQAVIDIADAIKANDTALQRGLLSAVWNAIPDAREGTTK